MDIFVGRKIAVTSSRDLHIGTEDLELYAMGRISEDRCSALEEHLLLCDHCQNRLEEFDQFLKAFRHAAARAPEVAKPFGVRLRELFSSWVLARPSYALGAVAAAVLAVVILVPRQTEIVLGTYAVTMDSTRGDNLAGVVSAPAHHRLQLSLDLRGVPPQDHYVVTIASATGAALFTTSAEPASGRLAVNTESGLRAGQYWIRVSGPGTPSALLREFGLQVK